jgi:hypothetical protein
VLEILFLLLVVGLAVDLFSNNRTSVSSKVQRTAFKSQIERDEESAHRERLDTW